MTDANLTAIIEACDKVARRITNIPSHRMLYNCMKAFEGTLKAEAVTFSVFLNAPVMRWGEATIHNDGRVEMRTI